jgi:hypothetical protein
MWQYDIEFTDPNIPQQVRQMQKTMIERLYGERKAYGGLKGNIYVYSQGGHALETVKEVLDQAEQATPSQAVERMKSALPPTDATAFVGVGYLDVTGMANWGLDLVRNMMANAGQPGPRVWEMVSFREAVPAGFVCTKQDGVIMVDKSLPVDVLKAAGETFREVTRQMQQNAPPPDAMP